MADVLYASSPLDLFHIRIVLLKTFYVQNARGVLSSYIASWSYGLVRDTGTILLDMADRLRQVIEEDGDQIDDLHLWRLGPGHLGAIVSVSTYQARGPDYYRVKLARFRSLSHLTIEVQSNHGS